MKTIPLKELLAKATPGLWTADNVDVWHDGEVFPIESALLAHAANNIGPLTEALEHWAAQLRGVGIEAPPYVVSALAAAKEVSL